MAAQQLAAIQGMWAELIDVPVLSFRAERPGFDRLPEDMWETSQWSVRAGVVSATAIATRGRVLALKRVVEGLLRDALDAQADAMSGAWSFNSWEERQARYRIRCYEDVRSHGNAMAIIDEALALVDAVVALAAVANNQRIDVSRLAQTLTAVETATR